MSLFKKTEKINVDDNYDVIIKETEFIPHLIYSNDDHAIIGMIYLTEDQAAGLNALMKRNGASNQDLAFLRK